MMTEKVNKRLSNIGYTINADDVEQLSSIMTTVTSDVDKTCREDVPEDLVVDMVVGEFLKYKKTFDPHTFKLGKEIKQIQEGDTNITYAVTDGSSIEEQRLDNYIAYLTDKNRLKPYWVMSW